MSIISAPLAQNFKKKGGETEEGEQRTSKKCFGLCPDPGRYSRAVSSLAAWVADGF